MKASWEKLTVHPRYPFRISRGVRTEDTVVWLRVELEGIEGWGEACLLYTSDAADDLLCVDLGGRRII